MQQSGQSGARSRLPRSIKNDVAAACAYLHGVLDRTKHEGLAAVLGELDYDAEEFSDDEPSPDEVPPLPALPW